MHSLVIAAKREGADAPHDLVRRGDVGEQTEHRQGKKNNTGGLRHRRTEGHVIHKESRVIEEVAHVHGFSGVYSEGQMGGWCQPFPQPDTENMYEGEIETWVESVFRPFEAMILETLKGAQDYFVELLAEEREELEARRDGKTERGQHEEPRGHAKAGEARQRGQQRVGMPQRWHGDE